MRATTIVRRNLLIMGIGSALLAASAGAQHISVQSGDLALGLSRSTTNDTLQQIRNGVLVGSWTALPWAQSTEFDNADGPFSHSGHLLALNFGTASNGGELYLYPTDGGNGGDIVYQFNTSNGGIETSRVAGLSVSPDNTRIAVFGYDTGSLYVLDYDPSLGANAITGATAIPFVSFSGSTQGTTWRDNDTILVYAADSSETKVLSVNANSGDIDVEASIGVRSMSSMFSDIEYNPSIEPDYIYCLFSSFTGSTENQLTVLDATTYAEVTSVTLDNSLNTGREIALGPDGRLFLGAYGGSDAVGPVIDTITGDPAQMTNDGSVDYYQAVGVSSSFNGLDLALGHGVGPTLAVQGSCPGQVTLTASGMSPNGLVGFLYARRTGTFIIPQGQRCAGTQLGLDRTVTLIATERANAQGTASLTRNVPQAGCGLFLQAIDAESCGTTNVDQL